MSSQIWDFTYTVYHGASLRRLVTDWLWGGLEKMDPIILDSSYLSYNWSDEQFTKYFYIRDATRKQ